MAIFWFIALFSSICLEGLGRKYIPQVPSAAFYFLKDLVLLYGLLRYRPSPTVVRSVSYLYRGFGVAFIAGMVWTLIELLNPEQESLVLGLIGIRAYWLWWIAPAVIASVLQDPKVKRRAIYVIGCITLAISLLAAFQFAAPADSSLNLYAVQDGGEELYASAVGTVAATGRARVSGSFTFLCGFVAFTLTTPALLLSLGLQASSRRVRWVALVAAIAAAATLPMSGSRAAVIVGAVVLLITMWTAGLFFTTLGRRVLIGGVLAVVVAGFAFPDAFLGVQSRFENTEETASRLKTVGTFIPPIALAVVDYPMLGIGTGMQQNARYSLLDPNWTAEEGEMEKYLSELGPVGFLLIWTAKLGLMVALLRAYALLKRAGKRGSAGAALSYAALTMIGDLAFDHNWQALYFTGCGFILAEVLEARRAAATQPATPEVQAEPLALSA